MAPFHLFNPTLFNFWREMRANVSGTVAKLSGGGADISGTVTKLSGGGADVSGTVTKLSGTGADISFGPNEPQNNLFAHLDAIGEVSRPIWEPSGGVRGGGKRIPEGL